MEPEALSPIHFMRDQDQPEAEWLDAVSADTALIEHVHEYVLQFARESKSFFCGWYPRRGVDLAAEVSNTLSDNFGS